MSSRVARHALSAGAATLLTRVSGLLREIVFAAMFGASMSSDAYLAALRVPNLFRDLFAEGSMSNAFVPNFAKVVEEEGLDEAWRLVNALLGIVLAALGLLTALTLLAAPAWVWVVAAGFADVPGKAELTATLVRIVSPFLLGVSLASVFAGMLNVRGRFFLPALAPAAFNAAVIAGCLVPPSWSAGLGVEPIAMVAVAATVGGLLQAGVQFPSLWRMGFRLRPTLRGHPALQRLLAFLGPALIGIATIQLGIVVDVQLAASHGDGPVSWLGYAFRLVQLPMTVFAGSLAVATLAELSARVSQGETDAARETQADALSLTSFLVVPSAVALGLFADPLVSLFYERGAFTAADTAATAELLRWYAVGTVAFCLHRVVAPSFYAWGDPWTPMVLSIATVAAKVPLALWLTGVMGVPGIPLAHAAVATAEVAVLVGFLGRRSGGWTRSLWVDHGRIAVAAGAMAGVAWLLRPADGAILASLGAMAASGAAYLLVAGALGAPQVATLVRRLQRPRGLPPHVDPDTRAALARHADTHLGRVVLGDGTAVLHTAAGRLELTAVDGELRAHHVDAPPVSGEAVRLAGILDVSRRPPPLAGLELSDGRTLCVRGNRIVEAPCAGPRLPVSE